MLEIVKYPNKILRQRTKKATNVSNPEIQKLISQMTETMRTANGIGLAAPQVGQNLKILVVKTKDGPEVFINPRVTWRSFLKKNVAEEGCLSFPEIFGSVRRFVWIKLRYLDKDGQLCKIKAQGLFATALQHELDHLKGILFIDKVVKYTRGGDKVKELIKQAKFNER